MANNFKSDVNNSIIDHFLSREPNRAVFGINLSCAFPLPRTVEKAYSEFEKRLSKFSDYLYIYPFNQTHITILTLISFIKNVNNNDVEKHFIDEIINVISPIFSSESKDMIYKFLLDLGTPYLASKAAIIPITDQDGVIPRIRREALQRLAERPVLHKKLLEMGLRDPGIIHCTIMRFINEPPNMDEFRSSFNSAVAGLTFGSIEIDEILCVSETKPYMRGGNILHRFSFID